MSGIKKPSDSPKNYTPMSPSKPLPQKNKDSPRTQQLQQKPRAQSPSGNSKFEIGSRALCIRKGYSKYFPCVIVNRTRDYSNFHVIYEDGTEEFPVLIEALKEVTGNVASNSRSNSPQGNPRVVYGKQSEESLKLGDTVEVLGLNNNGKKRVIGEIFRITGDGMYNIRLPNTDEVLKRVPPSALRNVNPGTNAGDTGGRGAGKIHKDESTPQNSPRNKSNGEKTPGIFLLR